MNVQQAKGAGGKPKQAGDGRPINMEVLGSQITELLKMADEQQLKIILSFITSLLRKG